MSQYYQSLLVIQYCYRNLHKRFKFYRTLLTCLYLQLSYILQMDNLQKSFAFNKFKKKKGRKKLVGRYFFSLRGFNVPSFFPIVNIFALEIIKPFIKEDNTKVFSSKTGIFEIYNFLQMIFSRCTAILQLVYVSLKTFFCFQ